MVKEILARGAWAPLSVFGLHLVAQLGFGLYSRLPWIDVPMHVLGGAAMAVFFTRALDVLAERGRSRSTPLVRDVLVLALVCAAAVGWELVEWVGARTVGSVPPPGKADPVADQFFGLIGAIAALLAERGSRRRRGGE